MADNLSEKSIPPARYTLQIIKGWQQSGYSLLLYVAGFSNNWVLEEACLVAAVEAFRLNFILLN